MLPDEADVTRADVVHKKCPEEHGRRVKHDECIFCGNAVMLMYSKMCSECYHDNSANQAKYKNY